MPTLEASQEMPICSAGSKWARTVSVHSQSFNSWSAVCSLAPHLQDMPFLWAKQGVQSVMIGLVWSYCKTVPNLEMSTEWTHHWLAAFVPRLSLCDPGKCCHVTMYAPGTLPRTRQSNISSDSSIDPCPEGIATRLASSEDDLWHWNRLPTSRPSIRPQQTNPYWAGS